MTAVAVVGASGRVGRAIAQFLGDRYEVVEIVRRAGETVEELAQRAVEGADVIVNAAGVAHVEQPTADDLARLRVANVDLPAALAQAALAAGKPLVHISSVKAALPEESAYAASKRDGEQALEGLADQFRAAGLSLSVIRPLALLFPPLDAGRVKKLAFMRRIPSALVPPVRLPVLAPAAFLRAVAAAVGESGSGYRVVDFGRHDRGTMRDVQAAFRASSSLRG